MIEEIVQRTFESFDFAFCIVVDILTYIIIKLANEKGKCETTWTKRLVLVINILIVGGLYILCNADYKLLINSAILAPVFWSWIMKPICKHYDVDYGTSKTN